MSDPRGAGSVRQTVVSSFSAALSFHRKFVAMVWQLAVRNKLAIAIASLIWLVWRSGTQPRRLSYPCQQAAAANLGFLAVLFIPGLAKLKARNTATMREHAFALATGTVSLAGVLFILISGGVAVYSSNDKGNATPTTGASTNGTGVPATVAIVKHWDTLDASGEPNDTEIDAMVRDAVAMAGGLESLMVDTRGGGAAPWDSTGDGEITVVVVPNMSGTSPGLNTNKRITHTVIDMAYEAGATQVKFGGAATGSNYDAFNTQGYDVSPRDWVLDYDVSPNPSVPLIDLNDTGTTTQQWQNGQYSTNNVQYINTVDSGYAGYARTGYYVHDELLKADVVIMIPVLKNHDLGTITMGMKMRIGTGPQDIYYHPLAGGEPFLRWEFHNDSTSGIPTKHPWDIGSPPVMESEAVQRSFVDLNLARPHDFVVIDGLVGNEEGPLDYNEPGPGDGPNYAYRHRSIIASTDTVAIDTIGALLMGYNPDNIHFIDMATDSQVLGVSDRDLITVVGDHVADVRVDCALDHPARVFDSYSQPVRADSISPGMTGMSPTEGAIVTGDVTVTGTGLSDNFGIIKAELTVDGTLAATNTTDNSASFVWDSTTVSEGPHQLTVTVYDAMMNEVAITRNVTVQALQEPWICVDDIGFARELFVGEDIAGQDSFVVSNCGQTGSTANYTVDWGGLDWLSVAPVSDSAIEGQAGKTHTISYATTDLSPGIHSATISVTGSNPLNVQTMDVTLTVTTLKTDIDSDGDVDQSDFGRLQACLNGVVPVGPECADADLNDDGFVNDSDITLLQACKLGDGVAPASDCMD